MLFRSLGGANSIDTALNKDPVINGWGYKYEGTSFRVSTIAQHGMDQAVYRFFNPSKQVHFYTASTQERDNVIRASVGESYLANLSAAANAPLLSGGMGYRYEGVAWYT